MSHRSLDAFAVCVVFTSALSAQNTVVVNDGALQPAIDAAAPGDILLVRPASLAFGRGTWRDGITRENRTL